MIEHTVDAIRRDLKGEYDEISKRLLASLLVLLPKFTKTKLTTTSFSGFLKTVNNIGIFDNITKEHHDLILDLIRIFLSDNQIQYVNYLVEHPEAWRFIESKEVFSKSLTPTTDTTTRAVLLEGREFLLNYYKK